MKNPVLVRNFFIFMLILGACLGGLAYNTIRSGEQIKKTGAWVNQTQNVMMETQKLLMLILNTVSAQRNYIILKQDSFLPVYEEAKAKMSDHIASLRDLTRNNQGAIEQAERDRAFVAEIERPTGRESCRIQGR